MWGSATSGYVADLPVRLSKKFYPLSTQQQDGLRNRIIDAPLRFPSDVLSDQYDFSTEKKALDVFQSNLLQYSSPAKVDPPQSDIDSSVEIESSTASSASSSCSSIPAGEETPYEMPATISYPLESVSSMPPLRPSSAVSTTLSSTPHRPSPSMNGILQPVIAKASAIRSVNKDPEPSRPVLRLEDFENVTCSPFDMVELKSINDIEELRRLWTHHPPNGFAS